MTSLPREMYVSVNDTSNALPTHMLAIFGQNSTAEKRKITMFPAHSTVLAAYCSKLAPFGPTSDDVRNARSDVRGITIPVRPISLPSPETYPQLSSFLYTKHTNALLSSMLPCLPPRTLSNEQSEVTAFATRLAATYTMQALVRHCTTIIGLWSNVCALGIADGSLWETIDLAWKVLLTAIAIANGTPERMIPA